MKRSNNKQKLLLVMVGLVLLIVLFVLNVDLSKPMIGRVIGIADGDTLFVWDYETKTKITVRLIDIDAPERQQPFGDRSRQSLNELCYKKPVHIERFGRDRYDRVLGRVFCKGIDANAEQVRRGMAWVYIRFLGDDRLYALQDEARKTKRGLWIDEEPEAPWRFRRYERAY
ncbi:thermonuclease family protein [Legionella fairfieldensis]|uniref:thermonuclease family protein n=1 Tax=Legionella fairfieldensis TaxID=45064 RepID=UPI0013EF85EC|nr:thermonuclease family protein [Legionella fairfieldensis]